MTVVVDASVAVKWVLHEEHTEEALVLRDRWWQASERVIAPPVFRSEVTNALHRYIRRGHLSRYEAAEALGVLIETVAPEEPPGLYSRALTLASELAQRATYDSLYLALAESQGCEFWTADRRFLEAARVYFPQVRGLTEGALGTGGH